MVNLNWKGKKDLKDLLNLKDLDVYPFQDKEFIFSPINENFDKNTEINHQKIKEKLEKFKSKESWENLLIWGENKLVMLSLLKNFSQKINLIYFDPPFATGGEFNFKIYIGERANSDNSQRWINKVAYSDTWKEGIDSYLNFMYERLLLMRELLTESGSIYVHLDWHVGDYIKIIMDEIFGVDNFRNEIIWYYPAASVQTKRFFVRSYDIILFYTKSDDYVFNDDSNIYMEYSDRVKKALKEDHKGIYYHRGGSHNGKKLSQKVYIKKKGVFPRDVWNDIPYVRANTIEYQGFSTQKPERLLKRIILASTNKNDIVADFFCGSGTTLIAAEKLGRRWIGCDSTKYAIQMTKKRLLDIYNGKDLTNWKEPYNKKAIPFKICSIGDSENEVFLLIEFLAKENQNKDLLNNLEKPNIEVEIHQQKKQIILEFTGYDVPFFELLSNDFKGKIQKWTDWIDYWAVDFDYQNDIFNPLWVSYKTPKDRKIKLAAGPYEYDEVKTYKIRIMAVDILGIETAHTYEMNIN